MSMAISYPKLFVSADHLQARVKEFQPNGTDFEKSNTMLLKGKTLILNENVANNVATFSIQCQSTNLVPYSVKIKKKHNLSRDKLCQFSFSCTCPHYEKRKITFCKHIIYVLRCYYVRD